MISSSFLESLWIIRKCGATLACVVDIFSSAARHHRPAFFSLPESYRMYSCSARWFSCTSPPKVALCAMKRKDLVILALPAQLAPKCETNIVCETSNPHSLSKRNGTYVFSSFLSGSVYEFSWVFIFFHLICILVLAAHVCAFSGSQPAGFFDQESLACNQQSS